MENERKEDESGAGGCASVTWPVCWRTWMAFHDVTLDTVEDFKLGRLCSQDVKCQS